MGHLRIDTAAVAVAAQNIGTINQQIWDGFDLAQSAVKELDKSWDGAASAAAVGKFNEIKSKLADARFAVMETYKRFLLEQVGQGYELAEDVNKKLADAFK